MCRYCDYDSIDNVIYIDPLDRSWYMDYQTGEWDKIDNGYIHEKIYIDYCPWCGRKLGGEK